MDGLFADNVLQMVQCAGDNIGRSVVASMVNSVLSSAASGMMQNEKQKSQTKQAGQQAATNQKPVGNHKELTKERIDELLKPPVYEPKVYAGTPPDFGLSKFSIKDIKNLWKYLKSLRMPKFRRKVNLKKTLEFTQQSAADDLVVSLKNIHGGNVTVMKDGVDIFRVHQPGSHGKSVSTITKIIEHNTPKGPIRRAASEISSFDQSTFDMLKKAASGRDGYSLRTLGRTIIMDVIILGLYSEDDANLIEEIASKSDLKLVWNYQQYNIEAETGIKDLKEYYKLHKIGILIENKFAEGDFFYSYPIINEVSDYFMSSEWNNEMPNLPRLFNFFDTLNESALKKIIVAFADEWTENTTVKIERIDFDGVKSRLNNVYVWCFGYRNLRTNTESRDDFHPLVLELEKETV